MGPDDESTEGSSWGELEEVESVYVADVETNDVSSGFYYFLVVFVVVVYDEGTLSDDVSSVSVLAFSGSEFLRFSASSEFGFSSETDESL